MQMVVGFVTSVMGFVLRVRQSIIVLRVLLDTFMTVFAIAPVP
jgi:hypothetical protein